MLEFELPLTKADAAEALAYRLVAAVDGLLNSGLLIKKSTALNLVTELTPLPCASSRVDKVRSTLIKLAHTTIDSEHLISIMKEHEYEFGIRRNVDPYKSEVIISTPSGILTFLLLA